MAAVLTRISAQEFLENYDTRGLELLDGTIEEVDIGAESAWVGINVLERVKAHTIEPRLGLTFANDVGIAVWPDRPERVRKPDGMYFTLDRLASVPPGWIRVVPSLIWEVVSPHDRAPLLRAKLEDYRVAAVPLVWVLYPGPGVIDILKPDGTATRLARGDTLTGGDVLPGFSVSVDELFKVP